MELLIYCACLLLASFGGVKGVCDSGSVFVGDVDIRYISLHNLQITSAIGAYRLERNEVGVLAFKHINRPDVYLLREPQKPQTSPARWVIATLPDDKKPRNTKASFQVWPDSANIMLEGVFEGDPWGVPGAWRTKSCQGGRTPVANLTARCVSANFGQCSTDLWRVNEGELSQLNGLYQRTDKMSEGFPVYSSGIGSIAVDPSGRWRLKHALVPTVSSQFVSTTQAERLEYVQAWSKDLGSGRISEDVGDLKIVCEPLPSAVQQGDPCAPTNPCKNNGTCISVDDSHYNCECRFDTVSVNCEQVRECKAPPKVVNGNTLFTSDLAIHGKAFYSCDVGYKFREDGAKAEGARHVTRFGVCDGSGWKGVPHCTAVAGTATIAEAYVHQCDFDRDDWCSYKHAAIQSVLGPGIEWQRVSEPGRGSVATLSTSSTSSSSSRKLLAQLRSTCLFLPTSGCLVVDFKLLGRARLTIVDDANIILWRTNQTTSDWTTATLGLPAGSNRLTFEATLLDAASDSRVFLDNIRVFQWDCQKTNKLLFPEDPDGALRYSPNYLLSLLSLVALLVYSHAVGL